MKLNVIDWVAIVLVIIGALNWLLVAFSFNLVNAIFGAPPSLGSVIVYILVGLSALWLIYLGVRLYSSRVRLNALDWIALVVVIVSALNWLLVAFGIDIGGNNVPASLLSSIVYVIFGLSGLWLIYLAVRLAGTREAV
jgi:uncharacterized protein